MANSILLKLLKQRNFSQLLEKHQARNKGTDVTEFRKNEQIEKIPKTPCEGSVKNSDVHIKTT